MAARYHNNIAEICESDLVDFEQVRFRHASQGPLCGVLPYHMSSDENAPLWGWGWGDTAQT